MYSPLDLLERKRRRPFQPMRITTSAGQIFDVHHPDLIMVGAREVCVGLPSTPGLDIYESLARIALRHITAIDHLPADGAAPT